MALLPGATMNNQRLGFGISFLVHAVAVGFFLSMSHFVAQTPILIDFSINGGTQEAGGSVSQSQKAEDKPLPAKSMTKQREAIKEKPAEVPAPIAEAKEQVQEESPVSVPVQEEPVQAAAVESSTPSSAFAQENGNNEGASSAAHGTSGVGDTAGQGRKGDENAKNLFLKEHYGYIRDTIMKNISYPYIARKRGITGKVVVSFIVCEKGLANDIKIVESSGYSMLDNNAIETIKKSSPFPKPPVRAQLVMPIAYKLE